MKKIFIAGNWKSNKTVGEAKEWLNQFDPQSPVVLCVPFTLLSVLKSEKFSLGAQDVSPFDEGAYTGEISARQIKELAEWVIIGHSERRKYFGETDEILQKKVTQAKNAGLKIIYCVPDVTTAFPPVDVVAYEPVWAIGTGESDTPENANDVCGKIKSKAGNAMIIYGGSVTDQNVRSFVEKPNIDGVLPGGASLDPIKFARLIISASSSS